jgi:hypothetical protein
LKQPVFQIRSVLPANSLVFELFQCSYLAEQPGSQLAALLASPALAVIPLIGDMLSQTEAALQSEKLGRDEDRRARMLSDQLDFALAQIHRNLGCLISWRGRHTHNFDLFSAALSLARGDSAQEAKLIRICVERFPEDMAAGNENIAEAFAWETYQRVEQLDGLADEFPKQIAPAAKQMHGWPMLRQRHHNNRARFESLAAQFNLGADYPLDTSKEARFRPDTPMVRLLDPLICQLHHIRRLTNQKVFACREDEDVCLRNLWREPSADPPREEVLAVLRKIRNLPPLNKATTPEWAKRIIVPLILAQVAGDYSKTTEPALRAIARQKGVKSTATFKSRLMAAVVPTLKSMARPR